MPRSEALKRAQSKYQREKQDVLACKLPKSEGLKIRAFCDELGVSVSAFLYSAILEYMQNHPIDNEKIP